MNEAKIATKISSRIKNRRNIKIKNVKQLYKGTHLHFSIYQQRHVLAERYFVELFSVFVSFVDLLGCSLSVQHVMLEYENKVIQHRYNGQAELGNISAFELRPITWNNVRMARHKVSHNNGRLPV